MIVLFLLAQVVATPAPPCEHARRVEVRGVENVGLVAPGIYRGSLPDAQGLDALKALGIKTVVNLRHYHGNTEEKLCRERAYGKNEASTLSVDEKKQLREIATQIKRQP